MAAKPEVSKAKTGANAVASTALILLALIFANVVLSRVFARIDFTHDKVYTLSPESKKLVANLPDRLTVKAFISSDLQPPFSQVGQYVRDILNEYASLDPVRAMRLYFDAIRPLLGAIRERAAALGLADA